jgi:hypothetical protein
MFFSKKDELNVLINLAAIDMFIDVKEVKLIHMIGKSNGLTEAEVDAMIKNPVVITNLGLMTDDEKFEHLYYLITMMKSDGRVLKNEIDFCETIAHRLGFGKGVVGAMSKHIYSDVAVHSDRKMLRAIANKYLG